MSSYWIYRLDTTKTNIDRYTWRLEQPQIHNQQHKNNQQIIPYIDIFDLETVTPSIFNRIQFRYRLNRINVYINKHLFPGRSKRISVTGRFRTANDEKTASLRT